MLISAIVENEIGHSVMVGVESSVPRNLQTMPLMLPNKGHDGKKLDAELFLKFIFLYIKNIFFCKKSNVMHLTRFVPCNTCSIPSFSPLTNLNSIALPAVFVLHLRRAIPMTLAIIDKVQEITGEHEKSFTNTLKHEVIIWLALPPTISTNLLIVK